MAFNPLKSGGLKPTLQEITYYQAPASGPMNYFGQAMPAIEVRRWIGIEPLP